MGDLYLDSPRRDAEITSSPQFSNTLENPIVVQHCLSDTQSWILDLIADSRSDFTTNEPGSEAAYTLVHGDIPFEVASFKTRHQIEVILGAILGKDVYLHLGGRANGENRLSIRTRADDRTICPSFASLSTGQLALFELFATIARYADRNNVNASLQLSGITGIVIIDEADLHLHAFLQRYVFAKLVKLFPAIQFIITTHSPLLLLGLVKELGEDGMAIIDMPSGDLIGIEAFSESNSLEVGCS